MTVSSINHELCIIQIKTGTDKRINKIFGFVFSYKLKYRPSWKE
jgi:hypothetical protein